MILGLPSPTAPVQVIRVGEQTWQQWLALGATVYVGVWFRLMRDTRLRLMG